MGCTKIYCLYLLKGTGNPNYQSGPHGGGSLGPIPSQAGQVPGHEMPQVLNPNPASVGFMPSMNPGIQRPGMGPTQPSSPTQPAQLQPAAAPATPPPTVQTVDTSNVPGNIICRYWVCEFYPLYTALCTFQSSFMLGC